MKKLGIFLLIVVFAQMVSSAHWISGFGEDALDGTGIDGRDVVMWNPLVGFSDNVTGLVGAGGSSGVSQVYLLDCEMLSGGCIVGDILSLKIFGERYISWVVNVTITGAGYDVVENLSLNSPPIVNLLSPSDSGVSGGNVDFNCSFVDFDDNVERVSLWGNWSGSWAEEDFVVSGFGSGSVLFSETLTQGSYEWNCFVEDNLGIGSLAVSNNSFFVDTTSPIILGISSVSDVCGFGAIPVECSVSDNVEVDEVIIQSTSPSLGLVNHSAAWISGNIYRASINLDEIGDWSFGCFANDSAGNMNYSEGGNVDVKSGNAELFVVGDKVFFDKLPTVENEILNASVNVSNSGCGNSGDFVVGFFDDVGNFDNVTVNLLAGESVNISSLWGTKIGLTQISVYVDSDLEVSEDNESNNVGIGEIYLRAWQGIFGNVSLDKILGTGKLNMSLWGDEEIFAGNVFVADSEADIEWSYLQAIGKDKLGGNSSGDFGEIDSLLEMGSYNDSINSLFNSGGIVNFSVFGDDIADVPYINSSGNGNFITGLLWDSSDSVDLEYDSTEGEDIIFVAKVNMGNIGSYGVYDYEISVPSKLRGYDSGDEEKVYLYYDLR